MPRGPATAARALIVMASSLMIGSIAGLMMQSRRSMLIMPIAYIMAIEMGHLNVVGPTVNALLLFRAHNQANLTFDFL
ncbi:MAG: hypothetical protein SVX43_11790 [Cyanobacteriota bacterium]|nr:hypothetical protein [Cyanobacteriota bacterium]